MRTSTIRVPERLCGPSRTGHGGYVAGLLAGELGGNASVRLRKGAPIDIPMNVEAATGQVRLFEGPDMVAEGTDRIKPEYLWAVLECAGGFAWFPHMVVLGGIEARVDSGIRPGEKCVATGWRIETEGRKFIAGSAVYSESGLPVAIGRATWIELPRDDFVALSRNGRR